MRIIANIFPFTFRAPDPNPLQVPGGATCRSSARALTTEATLLSRTGESRRGCFSLHSVFFVGRAVRTRLATLGQREGHPPLRLSRFQTHSLIYRLRDSLFIAASTRSDQIECG